MTPSFRIALAALAVIVSLFALADCASAAELEPFVGYGHDSHIARGCPRRCDQQERAVDGLKGGWTITAGKRKAWEIDAAHGFISVNGGKTDTASSVDVRFYPGRVRRGRRQ